MPTPFRRSILTDLPRPYQLPARRARILSAKTERCCAYTGAQKKAPENNVLRGGQRRAVGSGSDWTVWLHFPARPAVHAADGFQRLRGILANIVAGQPAETLASVRSRCGPCQSTAIFRFR